VLLALWDLAVCRGLRVTAVRPVRWVSKVSLVSPDPSVLWVSKGLSVPRGSLVRLGFAASRERLVPLACVVPLALPVLLVLLGFVARLVPPVSKARWVLLVSRVTPALRESRAILVPLDPRAPLAQLVTPVPTARTVSLVPWVLVEIVVHRVFAVLLDLLVPRA